MSSLSFSVIARSPDELAYTRELIEHFKRQHHIDVELQDLRWENARQKLTQVATYNRGMDVSQIGSTWLRDLVDMNAVRAFKPLELRKLGNPAQFVPAAWENASLPHDKAIWAMPWLVDARILFYRRDLLKQAGIDEKTAFATPQALDQTLTALRSNGVAIPWVVPTQFSWRTLQTVASWVWGAGADFISRNGKRISFMKPLALEGFRAFFDSARHLVESARGLSDTESDTLFMEGKAAVTISGPWIMEMDEERLINVGVTSPPGPAFIGGSHLVIWKHTTYPRQAFRLVQYLTSVDVQRNYGLHGLLPARFEALNAVNTSSREFSRYLQRVLRDGRSFSPTHLWALLEDYLSHTLAQIWDDVLAPPEVTESALDAILERRLGALADRLNMIFA